MDLEIYTLVCSVCGDSWETVHWPATREDMKCEDCSNKEAVETGDFE